MSSTRVPSTVCRQLLFICFYSLMVCNRHVNRISFCHPFFSFFSVPATSSALSLGGGKRALVTLPTPISLETDEAAFPFLFLPPSPLLFHPTPHDAVFFFCFFGCKESNVQQPLPHVHERAFERDGCVFLGP